jgi:formate dehydrogenase subunit delta
VNLEHLVQMVNDIANYFVVEPDHDEAVSGVAGHLKRFWDPSMRKQIIGHAQAGGDGLSELGLAAVRQLANTTGGS